ncbi:hypothetical protein CDAR_443131 [Caerostris darwini]|uniref:Uncharacterized protein n=1 Tax=Caerostris darwini TaxID=1538125 RepID=A0AAV4MUD4_9ARAC|nr:hypothetical protein CDAR_443131 [Caerostris darwini]
METLNEETQHYFSKNNPGGYTTPIKEKITHFESREHKEFRRRWSKKIGHGEGKVTGTFSLLFRRAELREVRPSSFAAKTGLLISRVSSNSFPPSRLSNRLFRPGLR